MKHFKYFSFDDVEVIAYCDINDDDRDCIKFIAVSSLGNIELTPGFDSEQDRDELWGSYFRMCYIAHDVARMVLDSFVPIEENYE